MTDQTVPCRTTQHCARHGFCHRCAPDLADASQHLVKAMTVARIDDEHTGALYAQLAAGVRDAARQASGQQPDTASCGSRSLPTYSGKVVRCVLDTGHPTQCQSAAEYPYVSWPNPSNGVWNPEAEQPDPTTADDPTPLRWGLGDVLHNDDDSTIVCMSGPDREPYWLELDPERAAALREDLDTPEEETHIVADDSDDPEHVDDCPGCEAFSLTGHVAAPAAGLSDTQPANDEAHPADVTLIVERRGATDWLMGSTHYDLADRDKALACLARRRKQFPNNEHRLVRETTTWTVEEDETR
ncbi:hypothetical protein AB0K23_01310 [Streptomyces sp. NPDC049602]|uniref:hypothetical protein n=1 Tax=Streptomyces sp. NPDC049602 TaxID=3155504 RepID=UPI00342DBEBB